MFYNLTIYAIEGIYIFLIVLGIAALIALIAFLIHRFLHFRLKENEKPDDKEILKEEMDRILTPIDDEGIAKQIEDYKEEDEENIPNKKDEN